MSAKIEKICHGCGEDVSQVKRTKDTQGNYYCVPCYAEAVAAKQTVASIAVEESNEVESKCCAPESESDPLELLGSHARKNAVAPKLYHSESLSIKMVTASVEGIPSTSALNPADSLPSHPSSQEPTTTPELVRRRRIYDVMLPVLRKAGLLDNRRMHFAAGIIGLLSIGLVITGYSLHNRNREIAVLELRLVSIEGSSPSNSIIYEPNRSNGSSVGTPTEVPSSPAKSLEELVDDDPVVHRFINRYPDMSYCFKRLNDLDIDRIGTTTALLVSTGKIDLNTAKYLQKFAYNRGEMRR